MKFFYRLKSITCKSVHVREEDCPACNKKDGLILHIEQQYLASFIPIMPAGKYGELECLECDILIPKKQWPVSVKALYKSEKKQAATPAKLWLGMLLLLVALFALVGYMAYQARLENRKNTQAEVSPRRYF